MQAQALTALRETSPETADFAGKEGGEGPRAGEPTWIGKALKGCFKVFSVEIPRIFIRSGQPNRQQPDPHGRQAHKAQLGGGQGQEAEQGAAHA